MGYPIYRIKRYENTPPIVSNTNITQEIPKFVLGTGKHQKSAKKSTKSK